MRDKSKVRFSLSQLIAIIALAFLTFTWMSGGIEALAFAFYSVVIIALLFLLYVARAKEVKKVSRFSIILLLFFILSAASYIWSINRFETLIGIILLVLAGQVYEITRKYLKEGSVYRLWKNVFIFASVASVIWGLPVYMTNNIDGRFVTPIYWPNVAAAMLVPPLLLSLYEYCQAKRKASSILYLSASSLLGSAFILTFSRASYLVFAVIIILIIWLFFRNKKFMFGIAITVLLSALLASTFYFTRFLVLKNNVNINFTTRDKSSSEVVNQSLSDRKSYWASSVAMIIRRPIIGTGYNTFQSNYPSFQKSASAETNDPHNYLLKITSELGIGGLMLFSIQIFYVLVIGWNKRKDLEIMIIIFSLTMLIGHSLLDFDMSYPAVMFLSALLLGLITNKTDESLNLTRFKILHIKSAYFIKWAVIVVISVSASISAFNYFLVKDKQDALIFYIYDSLDSRLDVISSANAQLIQNPNNLSAEAELMIALAINEKERTVDSQKLNRAKELIEGAIAMDRFDGKNYYLLARIAELQGDVSNALRDYEKSLALDPFNNLSTYIYYIGLLAKNGQIEKALSVSTSIISQYDDKTLNAKIGVRPYFAQELSKILKLRATLLLMKGQDDDALKDLQRAASLNPQDKPLEEKLKNNQLRMVN